MNKGADHIKNLATCKAYYIKWKIKVMLYIRYFFLFSFLYFWLLQLKIRGGGDDTPGVCNYSRGTPGIKV